MFDAAAATTAGDAAADAVAEQQAAETVSQEQASPQAADPRSEEHQALLAALGARESQEVVFVDGRVDEPSALLEGLESEVETLFLDSNRDGVQQIAEHLAGRSDISAIHIVAHGEVGRLQLGSESLTLDSMDAGHSLALQQIGSALGENADILVYGCDFSGGELGLAAAARLARITGADVASSSDTTGTAALGGDADLETHVGKIETAPILSPDVLARWGGRLEVSAGDDEETVGEDELLVQAAPGVLGNDFGGLTPGADRNYDAEDGVESGEWQNRTPIAAPVQVDASVDHLPSVASARSEIQSALMLDGSDGGGLVSTEAWAASGFANGDATFEFWLRPADIADRDVLLDAGSATTGITLFLDDADGDTQFDDLTVTVADGAAVASATVDLSTELSDPGDGSAITGEFIQAVLRIDLNASGANDEIALFINGNLAASDATQTGIGTWTDAEVAGIGTRINDNTAHALMGGPVTTFSTFEGELAQFRLYAGAALSAGEVGANFNAVDSGGPAITVSAVEGNPLNVGQGVTLPSGAQVTVNADGSYVYDQRFAFDHLQDGEQATDSFEYTANDGSGGDESTVAVNVLGTTDIPIPANAIVPPTRNYEATNDTNGVNNTTWQDTDSIGDRNWNFGTNVTPVAVTSAYPSITEAYDLEAIGRGATTGSFFNVGIGNASFNPATFELWFRPDPETSLLVGNGAAPQILFETGGGCATVCFGLSFYIMDADADGLVDDLVMRAQSNGSANNVEAVADLSAILGDPGDGSVITRDFIQAAGTYETGGTLTLYVNGNQVDTDTNPAVNRWAGSNGAGLGRVNSSVTTSVALQDFEGQMAIFRFYADNALTPAEVLENYETLTPNITFDLSANPASPGSVTEGDGTPIEFTVTVTGDALAAGNTASVTIVHGGTATDGTDHTAFDTALADAATATAGASYNAITDTLTFDENFAFVGNTGTFTFSLDASTDFVLELDETVSATLGAPDMAIGEAVINVGTAQSTIVDAGAEVDLSVTTHGDEAGPTNIVFTASLTDGGGNAVTNATGTALTVDIADLGTGSATSGADYTAIAANAQISITDGSDTGTFTVLVTDDAFLEPTETIDVQISNASVAVVSIGTDTATANIADNDTAVANLSVTTQGDENGPVNVVYTVTLDKVNNTGSAITFDLDDLGTGTATVGDDYTAIAANAQISVADGMSTGTLTVVVTDDALLESTETVDAQISNSSVAVVSIGTDTATANIADNDTAVANLSVTTQGDEDGPVDIVYTVTLDKVNNTGGAITFDLDDLGTGSATSGDDYTAIAANAQISVADGTSTGTLTVLVTDDALLESTETLIAQISNPSFASVSIGTDSATANITDNDTAVANLSVTTQGDEDGPVDIVYIVTLDKVNNTGSAITFDLDDLGTGSATAGDDYTAITASAQITVADGMSTGTLTVLVTDDALLESTETLVAQISNPSFAAVSIGTDTATANIADNDTATANLSVTTQGDEDGPVDIVYTVTLDKVNNTGGAITFDLDDLGTGSATAGDDYTAIAANAQITVADGMSTGTLTVLVTDDALLESTETLVAQLSNSSFAAVSIGTDTATANIADDDTAVANLSVTTQGDEDGPVDIVYTVTLDKVNNTGSAITFDLDDLGTGTATAGDDYTAIAANAQVSIADGSDTGTLTVLVTDDALLESTETLIAQISNPSFAAVSIGMDTATASIADNDTATANLSVTTQGDEDGPVDIVYTVTLDKMNNTGGAITFDLDDLGTGTATAGDDYTAIAANAQVSIVDGASTGTLTVLVTDDALLESTETLIAQISNASFATVSIGTDTATANIADNDTAVANLSVTTQGDEDGPVDIVFTVTLDKVNNTGGAFTFDLDDLGTGTATAGDDYTAIAANAQISIADGSDTGTLTVLVTDDALLESTETLTVQISNSSFAAVSIGMDTATANIADNDTATANLSVTTQGDEDGPVDIVYTVTLDKVNNTGSAITFDLDDLGTGTATSGDDYTAIAANAQITVADGMSTGTFTVLVTDDTLLESTETIDAQISNSSFAAVSIGTDSATANITDNDTATANLSVTTQGDEDGPVDIVYTVTLDKVNNTGSAITFDLDDLGTGTATAGDDYTAIAANAQVSIVDGASTGTLTVLVTDDTLLESTETLVAQISNSSFAAVSIGTDTATANIADNDTATANLSVTTQGDEDGPVDIVYTVTSGQGEQHGLGDRLRPR